MKNHESILANGMTMTIAACKEEPEVYFSDYQAVVASGAIERGWIPSWVLPASAVLIQEKHNIDTNQTMLAFRYSGSERFALTGCEVVEPRKSKGPPFAKAAAVSERLDGRLPQPATWIEGPGGLDPDDRPWEEAGADYAFVDELEALRPLVRGAASRERFGYWLSTFRYMRAMGELRCAWARLRTALAAVRSASNAATGGDGPRPSSSLCA